MMKERPLGPELRSESVNPAFGAGGAATATTDPPAAGLGKGADSLGRGWAAARQKARMFAV